MGMFDTFKVEGELSCPHCSKIFLLEQGLQSKSFESTLRYFDIGDIVELDDRLFLEEYEWCPHCQESVPIFLSFNNSIYIGGFETKDIAIEKSEAFDILKHYKSNVDRRIKAEEKLHMIQNDINLTYDLFSKKSTKNIMMSFLLIRGQDILDYNIVTTLKNIINKFKL